MMRHLLLAAILLLMTATVTCAQVVIDQIAATVNGSAITRSDVTWALALDPTASELGDAPEALTEMLDQLIDQRLLLNEAERLPTLEPSPAEVSRALADTIKRFASDAIFYEKIERAGLTAAMLQQIVKQRLQILKYIDFRFRSFAVASESELQSYFQSVYKPRAEQRGFTVGDKPTDEERSKIEAILIEQRIDREIEKFLENARLQADIVILAQF